MQVLDSAPSISPEQAAELARIDTMVVAGRSCGSCSLCCKPGRGCGIHLTRPIVCRGAYCEWMISKGLGPEWKPEKSKFALFKTNGGRRMTAHVDPGHPTAWRRSPYYENLKQWAREAAQKLPDMHVVDVMIGEQSIIILPDREVDLGIIAEGEIIRLEKRMESGREVIDVIRESRAHA